MSNNSRCTGSGRGDGAGWSTGSSEGGMRQVSALRGRLPAAAVDDLVRRSAGARAGRAARAVVGRRVAEGDGPDQPPALGDAEVPQQRLGAVEHPEPPGPDALV